MRCAFETRSGIIFNTTYVPIEDCTNATGDCVPVWINLREDYLFVGVEPAYQWMEGDLDVNVGPRGEIASVTLLQTDYRLSRQSNISIAPSHSVQECLLFLCEKTYPQSRFNEGTLKDDDVDPVAMEFNNCAGDWQRNASDILETRSCAAVPLRQGPNTTNLTDYSPLPSNTTVYWIDLLGLTGIQRSLVNVFIPNASNTGIHFFIMVFSSWMIICPVCTRNLIRVNDKSDYYEKYYFTIIYYDNFKL